MDETAARALAQWLDDELGDGLYAFADRNPNGTWFVYICDMADEVVLAEIDAGAVQERRDHMLRRRGVSPPVLV